MSERGFLSARSVVQVRLTRPTRDLNAVARFYCEGLGLRKLAEFEELTGFVGFVLGLPNWTYHLEFIYHPQHTAHVKPDPQNLLVLYIPEKEAIGRLVVRLGALGYYPVTPINPYWDDKAVTIHDTDGYPLVLAEGRAE